MNKKIEIIITLAVLLIGVIIFITINVECEKPEEKIKPIDNVTISEIVPAFDQVGGGIQFELPYNIKKLKELGFIKEIDKKHIKEVITGL